MSFLDNFLNMFRGKKEKRNNTANNNDLANMKDTHVAFGEDSGSLENQENERK